MEQNLFRYNWSLRNNKKGIEIKIKSKSDYHGRSCNRVILNTEYNDKRAIKISKLVETTWLSRYILDQ